MKSLIVSLPALLLLLIPRIMEAQNETVNPSLVITGVFLGETPPLRDLPTITAGEWQEMAEKADEEENNEELSSRSYPFASVALPQGPDPVWQRVMGSPNREERAPVVNFSGQPSPYYPPDCNGTVGPNHYMQTINTVYAIYNKTGTLVAGPSDMNTLFTGVTGASCNDGDPLVLYDEQASRWLAVEFSLCGSNDYMLVAVSTTNDPTGTWYKYSFDVADTPDYEKFGIWRDGYYMATNNSSGNDIYVFERSKMLLGLTAQAVGFDNPNRPTTIDGFVCVPPLDNDGTFAAAGEPGLFIAFNDDAIGGGSDQLWIYELAVNWTTPASSTFSRVQQLGVAAFDSNFGTDWYNITQPGTTMQLDAIPMVIMNPPQYRNFGTYETIVCCHTVDVDATDHAGIRWYELRRVSSGNWTIRQQGTYAPDGNSRWMGSIMLNGYNEIGLGFSVSSSTVYPGIRYCGQSSTAYAAANSTMDIAEEIIQTGAYNQTAYERWGDYSALQIDPSDDHTFWFTSEYCGSGSTRLTKIASFALSATPLTANFSASPTTVCAGGQVTYTDQSLGSPTSWSWTFPGGTPATSTAQNPIVTYNTSGVYNVSLTVTNASTNNTITKSNYITVTVISADFSGTPTTVYLGNTVTFTDNSTCSPTSWSWSFPGGTPSTSTSQNPTVTYNTEGLYSVTLTATNATGNDTETKTNYITAVNCENTPLPFSEDFSDGVIPNCWTQVDHQGNGQIWQFNNPGSRTINTTTGSNGFAILDSDHYGSGYTQNADLVSPGFNFSAYTTVNLSFQHYYYHYTGSSATLSYSINGGSTWTTLQTWSSSTANAATFSQDITSQVAGQSNVKFKWNYTGTNAWYWAIDDISITGTGPNYWTGAVSSDWNVAGNWSNGTVPTSTTAVIIPQSATNWPAYSSDYTVGSTSGNLTLSTGGQMTISGSLIINSGYTLAFNGTGEISLTGHWTDNGTFTPAQGTVKFTGSNPSVVTKVSMTTNIAAYVRSLLAKSMTALSGPTTGPTGDNGYADVPLGFTFNYLGTTYTQVRLTTNGWISMNLSGTTSGSNANLFSGTTPNTTIAPWFDNLNDDATSVVSYKTEGTAPTRVFTAEWYRILPYNTGSPTARISFQAKFFETTNVIEFNYGSVESGTHNSGESASIGIEDATSGSGHFIEATTGSTTTSVTNLTSTSNWPTVNYMFSPPVVTESFYNIILNKTSSYVDFNNNVIVNGTMSIAPGASFTVKSGKTLTVNGTTAK
jgi:PKD repeat protein